MSDTGVGVRDAKDPGHGALYFELEQWRAFVTDVRCGSYDSD